MTTVPKVVAPLCVVARIQDVPVLLVAVEIWPTQAVVHLDAAESERTKQLDHEHAAALEEAWKAFRRWRESGAGDQPPRPSPAETGHFKGLIVTVTDDLGTPYRPTWAALGGSDRTWRYDEGFRPGPPDDASTLSLKFEVSGVSENHTIALA